VIGYTVLEPSMTISPLTGACEAGAPDAGAVVALLLEHAAATTIAASARPATLEILVMDTYSILLMARVSLDGSRPDAAGVRSRGV
jgi:hypothetical protein